jgi:hypothetical protein
MHSIGMRGDIRLVRENDLVRWDIDLEAFLQTSAPEEAGYSLRDIKFAASERPNEHLCVQDNRLEGCA